MADDYHYPGHHEFVVDAGEEIGLDPEDPDDAATIDQARNDRQFSLINTIAGSFYEAPDAATRTAIYREFWKVAQAMQLKLKAVNAIAAQMHGHISDGGKAPEEEQPAEESAQLRSVAMPEAAPSVWTAPPAGKSVELSGSGAGPVVKNPGARPASMDPSPTGDQADDAAHTGAESTPLLGGTEPKRKR